MKKIISLLFTLIFLIIPLYCFSQHQVTTAKITSIIPSKAKVGETVIIRGSGFGSIQGKVLMGETETVIVSWSENQIIVAIPLGASSGKLKVVTPSNSAESSFTVLPSWNTFPSPTSTYLKAIAFRSKSDGWLMENTEKAETFHFDGKNWEGGEKMDIGSISDICFLPNGEGWAVGGHGTIAHYMAKKWKRILENVFNDDLNSVFFLTPKNGWAVGGEGTILHYYDWTVEDVSWKKEKNPGTFQTLNAVYFVSPEKGWAVGTDGTIMEYNKKQWVSIKSPTGAVLHGMDFGSKTSGWAVGSGGTILQYTGRAWALFPSPVSASLHSVSMVSDKEGWIVGDEGTILYYNGNSWQQVDSPTTKNLHCVFFISSNNGWAVGEEGTLIWYH